MRKNLLKSSKGIYKDPRDINDDEQDDDTKDTVDKRNDCNCLTKHSRILGRTRTQSNRE